MENVLGNIPNTITVTVCVRFCLQCSFQCTISVNTLITGTLFLLCGCVDCSWEAVSLSACLISGFQLHHCLFTERGADKCSLYSGSCFRPANSLVFPVQLIIPPLPCPCFSTLGSPEVSSNWFKILIKYVFFLFESLCINTSNWNPYINIILYFYWINLTCCHIRGNFPWSCWISILL